jgi:hypothetical protein
MQNQSQRYKRYVNTGKADFVKFTKANEVVEKKEDDFKKLNDRLDSIVSLLQADKGGKNAK